MTDVGSFGVDELGDFLIENEIPSDVVITFCSEL